MKNIINSSILFCIFISFIGQSQSNPPDFAQKVYDDLFKNLYATKQINKPVLQYFSDDENLIIDYIPSNGGLDGKIRLGVNFIELMRSFDKDSSNALAFVLGHEMAHIFLEQSNIDRVGSGYADKELRKKLKEIKDSVYTSIFERQADEQAIFNAHIGGYNVTHIAEQVICKIYEAFELKENLKGYPSLDERKQIIRFSVHKMEALLERFELGNLFFVSGNYEHSEKIYNAILTEGFRSAEIYNNLGLCQLFKVIESDTIYQKYEWPIYLDSKTKLISNSQRDIFGVDVKECLTEAIRYFELSKGFNGYKWSNLNLSIAHLLFHISGEDSETDHLEESISFNGKLKALNIPHYSAMNGILNHYSGDINQSKTEFIKNAETFPPSKRNLDNLFFGGSTFKDNDENPLNQLIEPQNNIFELFFNRADLIQDTTSKLMNSFNNTRLEYKIVDGDKYGCFDNRIIGKKIYFASFTDGYENITETMLITFADKIYYTNQFHYYIFKDWVFRYDEFLNKKVYLVQ